MSHYESVIEKMNERSLKNGRKGTTNSAFEQYIARFLLQKQTIIRGVGSMM
jgi:hypothetical protein